MIHFDFLDADQRDQLFHQPPRPVDGTSSLALRSVALGATLYSPGTRPTLAADLVRGRARGVTSTVACLEDAIADGDVAGAEANVVAQLRELHADGAEPPTLFIRVRHDDQVPDLVARLGPAVALLTGFVLPKFTAANGQDSMDAVAQAAARSGTPLLCMPVVEHPDFIHSETRSAALVGVHGLLTGRRKEVLAVRIGATDLSAAYGLRRSGGMTIYDVRVVADVIADAVNVLGRDDDTGFTITGPVWEYFTTGERIFKPQLRTSPFTEHGAADLREDLITSDLDGLIREVELDKANGLQGKTVIHPSHVAAVHALSVVTHEEYSDAVDVLGRLDGGVAASGYRNKMNEGAPHRRWANKVVTRAHAFGVAREDVSFIDLLAAGRRAERAGVPS